MKVFALALAVAVMAGCTTFAPSGRTPHSPMDYGANSTGTTPGWENQNPWPRDSSNAGYAR